MELEELFDKFLQFEYKSNMFEKSVEGIYYWKYVRFSVENDLRNYFDIYTDDAIVKYKPKEYKYSWREKVKISILKNTDFWRKRDILIIPHERKYEWEDGSARCIYTDSIDKKLKRSHYILDKKSPNGYYKKLKSKSVIYMDIESQFKITNEKPIVFTKQKFEEDIINPIETCFGIKVSLKDKNKWITQINASLNRRQRYEMYYENVLDIISPKLIIVVVGYDFDRMILCEVAKRRKIPVVELQHGKVSGYHVAYNYYSAYKNIDFPDYFFCYGDMEKESVRFPIAKENILPVGFPELEKESNIAVEKDDKVKIMFVSQLNPVIAEYAIALDRALASEQYEIIFKLHPKEYDDYHERYGKMFLDSNIHVVGNYKETVHQLLQKMDWVIGIGSTVLVEATMFDVKIVVLREGLYETMKDLYEEGYALLADSPNMLVEAIKENSFQPQKDNNKFYKKNSTENMLMAIEEIIRKGECTEG